MLKEELQTTNELLIRLNDENRRTRRILSVVNAVNILTLITLGVLLWMKF
jgi:hypothetical protein